MPSLPTSLIVVGLVVAWLVVLVPMVARRREEVPENTEESANFRVLQRDSASGRRRPIFSRTAMAHRARGDDQFDSDDDGAVEISGRTDAGDDGEGSVERGARTDLGARVTADHRERAAVRDGHEVATADRDASDSDASTRVSASTPPPVDAEGAAEDDWRDLDAPMRRVSANDYQRDGANERDRIFARTTATYDVSRGRADGSAPERPDAGGDEFRRTPIRRGRGGFDPAAADRARAYRFRQRQRVALALVVIAAAGAGVGLLGTGYGYVAAVASGVLLVLYLAYLRRQVRVENEIRDRRAARLARARQIRPGYRPSVAEQVYAHRTGEIPRPGIVGDYQVKSHARETVPPAGYGYGEPVDLEDSDPAFDDLEYYRPAAYGRRAG